jgi:ABC-type enterochelin transport system ATPase subunit
MAPLEDPTVAEMIRTLGSKVDVMGAAVVRVETVITQYVTQEQRAHDKEIAAVRHAELAKEVAVIKERDQFRNRLVVSSLLLPVIVGVLVWLLTKGQ